MTSHNKKYLTNIPEPSWLKEVSAHSCLNARDIKEMFNISHNTLDLKIKSGEFPPPDLKGIVGNSMFGADTTHSKSNQWKVLTIRKFFKQLKEKQNEKASTDTHA